MEGLGLSKKRQKTIESHAETIIDKPGCIPGLYPAKHAQRVIIDQWQGSWAAFFT